MQHGILFATYNLLKPLLDVCRGAVDVPLHKAAFKLFTESLTRCDVIYRELVHGRPCTRIDFPGLF